MSTPHTGNSQNWMLCQGHIRVHHPPVSVDDVILTKCSLCISSPPVAKAKKFFLPSFLLSQRKSILMFQVVLVENCSSKIVESQHIERKGIIYRLWITSGLFSMLLRRAHQLSQATLISVDQTPTGSAVLAVWDLLLLTVAIDFGWPVKAQN